MTNEEILKAVSEKLPIPYSTLKNIIKTYHGVLKESLLDEDNVVIGDICVIDVRTTKSTRREVSMGRGPRRYVDVPSKKKLKVAVKGKFEGELNNGS